ncbi:ketopantoate reductase PanE/ApbA family protein [Rhodococcus sp. MTM3W5.2]|uniref:NAD(P)-dependent oxidoreductase n=1 Tax=Rhodococcus sp. MTM3W5.2 TaxID=1805827 RepID=UPI0009790530|nr:ketopantoate reductase PanE/ApbA family protein [Rhodococcus sp. MTM3W5.2]
MSGVAVVGLGSMGAAVARNLLRTGHEVVVWNRSRAPVDELVSEGARAAADVADAFDTGVVLSLLADDAAVREVFLDSGVLDTTTAGAVHVNLSTISPALARLAAQRHAEHGVGYVSAPVFGRVAVAEAGQLNIVTAGDANVVARIQPILDAISARTWPIGEDPAQANVVKIAGNLVIASAIQSLSESVSLAERAGVDAARLVEVLTSTIVPGPVYTSYGDLVVRRTYEPAGFSTVLGRKDVDLARAEASAHGLTLPVGDLLSTLLGDAIEAGRGRQDWASLAEIQRHRQTDS